MAAILPLLVAGCASPVTHGIPNFSEVAPGLYRGGQPTREGWDYLRGVLGVTNIVKLNTKQEANDDPWFIGYYRPITLSEQMGIGQLWQASLDADVSHMHLAGTFVHCSHGQDRTGIVVALYRVKVQGWSKADAEKEMLAHGFHKELRGLWEFWENYKP
jgi:hypothetical protein